MRAPGPDAAAMMRRYLKDYGHKVNQSKALLTALSRNPAPAAIQAVLAAANRLKQKTVQALARELIDDVAERRGWTADELADRTIPDSGFDETGEMELDCGEGRMFRAVYRGDGKIELLNPDGKVVKALPAVRNDADKEPLDASKKALSGARKEVKQVETDAGAAALRGDVRRAELDAGDLDVLPATASHRRAAVSAAGVAGARRRGRGDRELPSHGRRRPDQQRRRDRRAGGRRRDQAGPSGACCRKPKARRGLLILAITRSRRCSCSSAGPSPAWTRGRNRPR